MVINPFKIHFFRLGYFALHPDWVFILVLLCACSPMPVNATLAAPALNASATPGEKARASETITPSPSSIRIAIPTPTALLHSVPTSYPLPTATPWYNHFAGLSPGQYVLYRDSSFGGTFAVSVDGKINRKLADTSLNPFRTQGRQLWFLGRALFDWEQNTVNDLDPRLYVCEAISLSPGLDMVAGVCWVDAKDIGSHLGKLIVYSAADGSQVTLLEREDFEYNIFDPQWSPDGKWLSVFLGYINYGPGGYLGKPDAGLYLFDVACLLESETCPQLTGPFRVPANVWGGFSWSPDSQKLVMVSDRVEGFEIFDVQSKRFYSLPLTAGYGGASTVSWSPDGLWLAYAQQESGTNPSEDVFVMPAKGGTPIRLVDSSGTLVVVDWVIVPLLMQIGKKYTVTQAGANLHLRTSPTLAGKILQNLQPGDRVLLVDGPIGADGYRWWKMRSVAGGLEGWAVEHPEWYEPTASP